MYLDTGVVSGLNRSPVHSTDSIHDRETFRLTFTHKAFQGDSIFCIFQTVAGNLADTLCIQILTPSCCESTLSSMLKG